MRNIDFPERGLIVTEFESCMADAIRGLIDLSTAPHFWQKISPASAEAPHLEHELSAVSPIPNNHTLSR